MSLILVSWALVHNLVLTLWRSEKYDWEVFLKHFFDCYICCYHVSLEITSNVTRESSFLKFFDFFMASRAWWISAWAELKSIYFLDRFFAKSLQQKNFNEYWWKEEPETTKSFHSEGDLDCAKNFGWYGGRVYIEYDEEDDCGVILKPFWPTQKRVKPSWVRFPLKSEEILRSFCFQKIKQLFYDVEWKDKQ